ncbi:putative secretion system protein [Weissella oryzae SG25]|uniref:Putative secretion system protein n=1 Tax=Weissella oryzae (strain DSM 25784 / JCM 18191 / LMG 30913 / SG25) TaxID=1329250 RepID=A0A069CUX2_WEIOS|nr:hypothetical protein [Weissella oryzae]GAK31038.1 putative secretion system protein [Weissella oryzae SG25]
MVTLKIETPNHNAYHLTVELNATQVVFSVTSSKYLGAEFVLKTLDAATAEEQYYYLLRIIGSQFFSRMSEVDTLTNLSNLIHTILKNWELFSKEENHD